MDISVIVATYNQQHTISRTLDSILAQRFDGEFEILIGDDASTDATSDICSGYARRFPGKVRHIRRPANLGIVGNYFDCIRRAKAPLLADCAGDDHWVDPYKLQRQFDFLNSHPEVSMVTTDWVCCSIDGSNPHRHELQPEVTETRVWPVESIHLPLLTLRTAPHLCTALYRRSHVLEAMTLHPELMTGKDFVFEDTQIILALNHVGAIAVLPGISLHYSVGHDSISCRRDFGPRLDHLIMETRQLIALADHYLKPTQMEEMRTFLRSHVDYMWAIAYRASDPERVRNLRNLLKEHTLRGNWKSMVYSLLVRLPLPPLRR